MHRCNVPLNSHEDETVKRVSGVKIEADLSVKSCVVMFLCVHMALFQNNRTFKREGMIRT